MKVLLRGRERLARPVLRQADHPPELNHRLPSHSTPARHKCPGDVGEAAISKHPSHDLRLPGPAPLSPPIEGELLLCLAKVNESLVQGIDPVCIVHPRAR